MGVRYSSIWILLKHFPRRGKSSLKTYIYCFMININDDDDDDDDDGCDGDDDNEY